MGLLAEDSTIIEVLTPLGAAVIGGALTAAGAYFNQRHHDQAEQARFAEDRAIRLREQRREAYVRYWRRYEEYLAALDEPGATDAAARAWNESHHEVVLLATEDVRSSAHDHRAELDRLAASADQWRRSGEEREQLTAAEEGLSQAMTFEVTRVTR